MAINTYASLKTTIANYLNRSDLTSYIGDFISLTESRLNRELRVREMVNIDTSITTVASTQSYSLSDSNTTNTILTNYPDLYLYGALAESAPFIMQDDRLKTWAGLYKEALKNANESSSRGATASSTLQMSAIEVV
jgi:hypothetical protein